MELLPGYEPNPAPVAVPVNPGRLSTSFTSSTTSRNQSFNDSLETSDSLRADRSQRLYSPPPSQASEIQNPMQRPGPSSGQMMNQMPRPNIRNPEEETQRRPQQPLKKTNLLRRFARK